MDGKSTCLRAHAILQSVGRLIHALKHALNTLSPTYFTRFVSVLSVAQRGVGQRVKFLPRFMDGVLNNNSAKLIKIIFPSLCSNLNQKSPLYTPHTKSECAEEYSS